MRHQCKITSYVVVVATLLSCSVLEGDGTWELEEKPETYASWDCSEPAGGDLRASDELTTAVYRAMACKRGEEENILFSPVTIRLALGEWVEGRGDTRGELLAERLGYQDGDEMIEEGRELRRRLLERKPIDYERSYGPNVGRRLTTYEEKEPERLRKALGVEFYGVGCDEYDERSCQWTPLDDRDPTAVTLNPELAPIVKDSPTDTLGLTVRGQWENSKRYHEPEDYEFVNASGDDARVPHFASHRVQRYAQGEDIGLSEWRLIGAEVAVIFVGGREDATLQEVESEFFSRPASEWVDMIDNRGGLTKWDTPPDKIVPAFAIDDAVDVSSIFGISSPLKTATTMQMEDDSGFNDPELVTQKLVDPDFGAGGVAYESPSFVVDAPFLFFVYDRPTESVLKMGRVAHPETTEGYDGDE